MTLQINTPLTLRAAVDVRPLGDAKPAASVSFSSPSDAAIHELVLSVTQHLLADAEEPGVGTSYGRR